MLKRKLINCIPQSKQSNLLFEQHFINHSFHYWLTSLKTLQSQSVNQSIISHLSFNHKKKTTAKIVASATTEIKFPPHSNLFSITLFFFSAFPLIELRDVGGGVVKASSPQSGPNDWFIYWSMLWLSTDCFVSSHSLFLRWSLTTWWWFQISVCWVWNWEWVIWSLSAYSTFALPLFEGVITSNTCGN